MFIRAISGLLVMGSPAAPYKYINIWRLMHGADLHDTISQHVFSGNSKGLMASKLTHTSSI